MSKANVWQENGGPVFPRQLPDGRWSPTEALEVVQRHAGMDMLDHFAGLAMQAIIPDVVSFVQSASAGMDKDMQNVSALAYRQAGFMVLAARAARTQADTPPPHPVDFAEARGMAAHLEVRANRADIEQDGTVLITNIALRELARMLRKLIGE